MALFVCAGAAPAQQEPPRRLELDSRSTDSLPNDTLSRRHESSRELRSRFVRDQTVLGFAVYAPAFAAAVADDGVTGTAAYLVMAGGSFFAAAELTRHVQITEARLLLSSGMALRGAASALLVATQSEAGARQLGAYTLIGGLGGTAVGLGLGGGLTGGEASATLFGHDLAFLSAMALTYVSDATPFDDFGTDKSTSAATWTVAGWLGYAAGRMYAGHAPYNVTVGDVQTLWLGGSIGALAAGTAIASSDPSNGVIASTLLGGTLVGVFGADRLLVRRYDHSRTEGNLVSLGGAAGAVMGIGIGVLVSGKADRGGSATIGFATLGAIGGVAMAERYLQPTRDAGRLALLDRVQLDPMGVVAVATGRPGHHALLRYTF